MIRTLPSFLQRARRELALLSAGHGRAGEHQGRLYEGERTSSPSSGIKYVAPLVSLAEPALVPKQIHQALQGSHSRPHPRRDPQGRAAGYATLEAFNRTLRRKGTRDTRVVRRQRPAVHPDLGAALPHGSGHRTRNREPTCRPTAIPSSGANICRSIPISWIGCSARTSGTARIKSPFDIRDVWPSSYSGNTNEILWGAKVGARMPWVTCVIRLTSYECGMDQPTYTPVQQIVEHSGTLFFSFPGPRLDEACGIREDQSRDDCLLSGTFVSKHHQKQEGVQARPASALASRCRPAALLRRERACGRR